MSVTGIATIRPRMWVGFDDPGLPIGAYLGYVFAAGDATGGSLALQLDFKPVGQPANGNWYNIEHISCSKVGTGAQENIHFAAQGFEEIPGISGTQQVYRGEFQGTGSSAAALHYQQGFPPLPLFLGQSRPFAPGATSWLMLAANVAGIFFEMQVQGYVWTPRSLMAPGGMRRPVDSAYGR